MSDPTQPYRSILIFQEGEYVETRQLRLAATPDGHPGVLYRGLIHPLDGDDRIELAGPAHVPGSEPEAPARRAGPQHLVVHGDRTGYVLLTGSVADRELAAAAIRKCGADVARTGRYLGDPLNDFTPDWFIRFEIERGSVEAVEGVLTRLFPQEVETLSEEPDAIRLRLLSMELGALRAEIAGLRAENARLRVERAEAIATRDLADHKARERVDEERAALMAALEAEQAARAEAERLAAEAPPPVAPFPASRSLKEEVEVVARTFLPHIRFLRDGLLDVTFSYRDRAGLYRALSRLDPATFPSDARDWKKVQGLTGWWERHVSDGTSDAGRLYARVARNDGVIELLASTKGEQSRDLAWLRRQ